MRDCWKAVYGTRGTGPRLASRLTLRMCLAGGERHGPDRTTDHPGCRTLGPPARLPARPMAACRRRPSPLRSAPSGNIDFSSWSDAHILGTHARTAPGQGVVMRPPPATPRRTAMSRLFTIFRRAILADRQTVSTHACGPSVAVTDLLKIPRFISAVFRRRSVTITTYSRTNTCA